jgi:hypothetical protein
MPPSSSYLLPIHEHLPSLLNSRGSDGEEDIGVGLLGSNAI